MFIGKLLEDKDYPSIADTNPPTRPVSFMELSARAQKNGRILIGYVKHEYDETAPNSLGSMTTVMNPDGKIYPIYWHTDDFLILIGKDSDEEINSDNLVVVR